MIKVALLGVLIVVSTLATVPGLNYQLLSNASWTTRINASYVNNHWLRHKLSNRQQNGVGHAEAQVDGLDVLVHLDNRVLHCPPDSELGIETQHDEAKHAYSNYVVKTGIFSFVIASGLVCNTLALALLQYFEVSPMRAAMRAEGVAATAYLIILIPLYPMANLYPHTGKLEFYEMAKPYVTTFFQTCLDIAEFLYIWTFIWLNKLRNTLVVHYDSRKAEKCTAKSARDELRLMTCLAIVLNLPKYFDSEIKSESDPCRPGTLIAVREPNVLGSHMVYILFYQVFLLSLVYYVIPFIWLAMLTHGTHTSLNKEDLSQGDTKQSIMDERSKTSDGLTTELDKRVLIFYVLLLPGAFFQIVKYIQYLLPKANQGYDKTAEIFEAITTLLSALHAAYAPFFCYIIWYNAFWEKLLEQYWERIVNFYKQYKRRREHQKQLVQLEERLRQEVLNSTVIAGHAETNDTDQSDITAQQFGDSDHGAYSNTIV